MVEVWRQKKNEDFFLGINEKLVGGNFQILTRKN